MTTKYEQGRFWVIDALTLEKVDNFPSFATWREARAAIGDRWVDALEPEV